MPTTLARSVSVEGIGLHSGQPTLVTLVPAPPETGRVFVRTDLPGEPAIPALWPHVSSTHRATSLCKDNAGVSTVEHLLAALVGLGIDNVRIETTAEELPALDGSATPWVAALDAAGRQDQPGPTTVLAPTSPIRITQGNRSLVLDPATVCSLRVQVDFDHPDVGVQELDLPLDESSFRNELAWARTFGFEQELEHLRAQNLVRGASLENAVVYGKQGVLNPEGLRSPDEVVRHKALDLVGDLALLGQPILGRLTAIRPGHGMAIALVRALAQSNSSRPGSNPG